MTPLPPLETSLYISFARTESHGHSSISSWQRGALDAIGFYPGAVCLGSPEENGGFVSEEKEQWLGLLPAVSATLRIEAHLGVSAPN